MSNSKFPLKVNLENLSGKVVASDTIDDTKDTCTFGGIPKGIYQAKGKFTDGTLAQSKEVKFKPDIQVTFYLEDFLPPEPPSPEPPPPEPPPPEPPQRPPWKVIISSAVSVSLLSNFGGAEPLFREIAKQLVDDLPLPRSAPPNPPQNNLPPRNPSPPTRPDQFFSPAIEARLRECILSNFVSLADIPTLSGLLASASWDREPSGEFEQQLLFWYVTVGELRATIDGCDPALTQQVIAASERYLSPESVIVTGELVNVRVGSNGNEAVMDRVTKGTVLSVDQETELNLSFDQRLAIEQGIGWQPVFLPDGRRGYIYSFYITPQSSP